MARRLWSKVLVLDDDSCWLWTAGLSSAGYAVIAEGGKHRRSLLASRVVMAMTHGMYDQTLLVLHTCDEPRCVNPNHLYFGDYRENARDREVRKRSWQSKVTHCPQGHEYTEANTARHAPLYGRTCRACRRERDRQRRAVSA